MSKTSIEWTDYTFNIAWGCQKVSPGCAHCYAEGVARRYFREAKVFGPAATTPRRTFGVKHWAEPLSWNRAAERAGQRRRVFCSSMCDVFEDHPTIDAEREELWPLIRETPWLDWLILTKRPERIRDRLPDDWASHDMRFSEPYYPNVWLGTSVESQAYVSRLEPLLVVPAAIHFVSCEPLLGPLALRGSYHDFLEGWTSVPDGIDGGPVQEQIYPLDWVIAGGESGPYARPCELEWLRSLRDECAAAGVPFFLKQLGGSPDKRGHEAAILDGVRHREWPCL